ncbi:MAG TPA: amino acid permease [Pyrinomonadaceae bacterium]|nr:amino acid permease [Pyrinomonadaceae bacterium]
MAASQTNLKRQYGLMTAIALLVGQVIAVGIFLTPAGMAKSVGSPFLLLVIWLVMGAMSLSGALCYGELASRFPEAGGSYVYLREAYGRPVAFLYGWMVLLVLDPGLTAVFAIGLTSYVNHVIPLSDIAKPAIAIAAVVAAAAVNIVGAGISSTTLKILTAFKVGVLLFIIAFSFLGGRGDWANFSPFFAVPGDIFGALAGGLVGAFFAFAGWWELSRLAGEVRDPEKNLPKALAAGVIILTAIYIGTSAAFMYLVPTSGITNDETFAAQAGEALFGSAGGVIFATVVVISILGTLVAYLMASPRVYYAMARDGIFFDSVARLHPRFNTPHRAILIQVLLASILILAGDFQQILSYFFFVVVLFIGMTVASLFVLRRGEFDGYKTPLYPLTPIVFLAITAIVLVFIGMRDPARTLLGVTVVLIGLPVYYLVFRNKGGTTDGLDQNDPAR